MRKFVPLKQARRNVHGAYPIRRHSVGDVDGDGDADLIQVWEPTEDDVTPYMAHKVRLSDGSEFGDPVDWGKLECGERSEEHTSELQSLMRLSYDVFCLKE